MSEYEAKDYIKFIEIDRRDKISPYGLKEIAKKYRELEQQNKELIEFIESRHPTMKQLNYSDFHNGYEKALSDITGFIELRKHTEEGEGMKEGDITLEQIQAFYNYLKNDLKLTGKKAFSIIFYLQEQLRIIPDHYEKCSSCKELYDTWSEGEYIESKGIFHCGRCIK